MGRDYDIVLARDADARGIADMSRELIEDGLGWSWRYERVLRNINARNVNVPTIRVAREIVAFAIMHYRDTEASILLFAVLPEHRRKGMARALVTWLLETARVAGIETIYLEARIGNRSARAFYEATGFEIVEMLPGYYQGRESAVRMALKVTATVAR